MNDQEEQLKRTVLCQLHRAETPVAPLLANTHSCCLAMCTPRGAAADCTCWHVAEQHQGSPSPAAWALPQCDLAYTLLAEGWALVDGAWAFAAMEHSRCNFACRQAVDEVEVDTAGTALFASAYEKEASVAVDEVWELAFVV